MVPRVRCLILRLKTNWKRWWCLAMMSMVTAINGQDGEGGCCSDDEEVGCAEMTVPDKSPAEFFTPNLLQSILLLTRLGLDRDLAVIGAGSRAEIWAADAWDSYLTEKETAFSETDEDAFPGIL